MIDLDVSTYAGLDVIGDPQKTLENTKYMESKYGLNPLPTFHVGSDIKYLKPLLSYNYIAIDSTSFDRAQRFGLVTYYNEENNIIYTTHLNEWRKVQEKNGIAKELLNNNKYIREETVKIGIDTFQRYQNALNNKKIDYSYLLRQTSLL